MIKVAVGSKNPIKIKAVESICKKVFGDIEIQAVEVDSGVSQTPSPWEEIAKDSCRKTCPSTSLRTIVGNGKPAR